MAFACGAAVLCAAAWYFGRPTIQPDAPTPIVVQVTPTEAPKDPPPKMIEVIDLARAYEPVREPEPVSPGGVDPASFIEEPTAPRRIPPAFDEENPYADVIRTVQEGGGSNRERIELIPRVVPPTDDPGFWGIGSGPVQNLLHFSDDPPHVRLDVMPREIDWSMARVCELYFGETVRVGRIELPPGSVGLYAVPHEMITFWLQIAELYGFVGVESER